MRSPVQGRDRFQERPVRPVCIYAVRILFPEVP